MIVIQGKRGLIKIAEPRQEPTSDTVRNFYNVFLDCLIEIQKEQQEKENLTEKIEATS